MYKKARVVAQDRLHPFNMCLVKKKIEVHVFHLLGTYTQYGCQILYYVARMERIYLLLYRTIQLCRAHNCVNFAYKFLIQ